MNKRRKTAIFFIVCAFIIFSLSFYSMYNVNSLVISNLNIVHNSSVAEYDISNVELDKLGSKLDEIEKKVVSSEIIFTLNDKEYKYSLYELGVGINKDKLSEEIYDYEHDLDYWTLYKNYSKDSFEKKIYDFEYVIDEKKLDSFLNKMKKRLDKTAKEGHLEMDKNRNLKFVGEVVGFNTNILNTKKAIIDNFKDMEYNKILKIEGDNIYIDNPYKVINTKISSFTTTFDDTISRKYNLIAGAKQLDGKIVKPHETFSFFDNVGPYTSINEFVYYLGVMGNGVCQVATTLYNAELLAGLTTVERYNHGKKSVYVDGGLDATVAVTKGVVTDFKFRNDYNYPVYISAFVKGDKLTIEMWSNETVKNGKEYKTESKRLSYGAYQSYRYTYKDDQLIKTEYLGNSYYFSE